jgi:hypothetical protein
MRTLLTTAHCLSTLASLIGAFLLACLLAWGFNWLTLLAAMLALFSGARLYASMQAYHRRYSGQCEG